MKTMVLTAARHGVMRGELMCCVHQNHAPHLLTKPARWRNKRLRLSVLLEQKICVLHLGNAGAELCDLLECAPRHCARIGLVVSG
jgi:hypothetical protein